MKPALISASIFAYKHRKGQTFELLLVVGVLFILIQGYLIIANKKTITTEYGKVGDTAIAIPSSTSIPDDISLYIHEAASLLSYEALGVLGARGGMGKEAVCGIINGYSLWNTIDKSLQSCKPQLSESYFTLFTTSLDPLLSRYQSPEFGNRDLRRHFDLSLTNNPSALMAAGTAQASTQPQTLLTGTSPEQLKLPLKDSQGRFSMAVSFYPSFIISGPDLVQDENELYHGVEQLLESCSNDPHPFDCASRKVYDINTAPEATLKWKAGPCAGDLAPTDPHTVFFCIQAPRNVLIFRQGKTLFYPMLYKIALTLQPSTSLHILFFQANGIPISGNPLEKGGLGLDPGSPLPYHARIIAPDLNGLRISLCYAKDSNKNIKPDIEPPCIGVPDHQWNTESFSTNNIIDINGIVQPPFSPPYTLTLTMERKGQRKASAGIDIVNSQ